MIVFAEAWRGSGREESTIHQSKRKVTNKSANGTNKTWKIK